MKKIALAILVVFMVFGMMPGSVVQADGEVSPTPWFTIIGGNVTIAGQPAATGTDVDFFCQENLSGHGETYDYSETQRGVLGWTHVYGSDLSANPQIFACEEGDQVKVYVNGMRAVMSPQVTWTNDWSTHLVSIDLDSQITFLWGTEALASIGMSDEPIELLRKWSPDGSISDFYIDSFPYWENYPTEEVSGWSLTNTLGKTRIFSAHDQEICPIGPDYFFSRGGGNFIARVENTTSLTLQIILQLGDQIGPAGLLSPGGTYEVTNTAEIGSLELLVGDENGPRCAILEWDYRNIPAPRVVFPSGENRTVTIKGDNFFPYLGADFDPATFRVWFIKPDWSAISYEMSQIEDFGGSWEPRQIRFDLPNNFPAGTYMLKVSMSGRTSENGVYITIPDSKKIFLPIIIR